MFAEAVNSATRAIEVSFSCMLSYLHASFHFLLFRLVLLLMILRQRRGREKEKKFTYYRVAGSIAARVLLTTFRYPFLLCDFMLPDNDRASRYGTELDPGACKNTDADKASHSVEANKFLFQF